MDGTSSHADSSGFICPGFEIYIYICEISVAGPVKGGVLETLFVVLTELKNNQKRRWMIHRTQCEQFSFEL